MTMILINGRPDSPCEGKGALGSDTDTVSTIESNTASLEKRRSSSSSFSSDKSPSVPQRRSIFNTYWNKQHSSLSSFKDDDNSSEGSGREARRSSTKLEPSYKGVYSFAPPSPFQSPRPGLALSPISSTDSLTPSPVRPKSILRRNRSARIAPVSERPKLDDFRRPRSVSCIEPQLKKVGIAPPPFLDDHDLPKAPGSDLHRHHSFVHFDPTITVRECVGEEEEEAEEESNWFSENELRTFMAETINICHHSAVNAVRAYNLPAVKKAYLAAHEAGVKSPVVSSTHPEYRALYADPVLHATDDDAIVHDGSKSFFKIVAKEMQRVLIVDNSPTTLKLFQRHILCLFPHAHVDTALSGEAALDKIEVGSGLNYDLIIVEERLQQHTSSQADADDSLDLTGSELLRLVNEMELSASPRSSLTKEDRDTKPSKKSPRSSLKIGVSVSLGEDCETLRNKGGADLFWSKPPPKPSNGLRNQIINALLSKRGKAVFVCGL